MNPLKEKKVRHSTPPKLIVVIHTEEEFDWSKPLDSGKVSVTHIPSLCRIQSILEDHGAVPLYAVDYPVVIDRDATNVLYRFAERGAAQIGTHLHPWVSPPFEEGICAHNSYPGNLPEKLEFSKIQRLSAMIKQSFGIYPKVYLAGRYGIGPNTYKILEHFQYHVDLSPAAGYDFSDDGGPDYSTVRCSPYLNGKITVVPHTSAYIGSFCRHERPMLPSMICPTARRYKLLGLLARLGFVRRIRLSPEGHSLSQMLALTRDLISQGLRIFVFSFHSPSVVPGLTPYVRTNDDADLFHMKIDRYLHAFQHEFCGEFSTPEDIAANMEGAVERY